MELAHGTDEGAEPKGPVRAPTTAAPVNEGTGPMDPTVVVQVPAEVGGSKVPDPALHAEVPVPLPGPMRTSRKRPAPDTLRALSNIFKFRRLDITSSPSVQTPESERGAVETGVVLVPDCRVEELPFRSDEVEDLSPRVSRERSPALSGMASFEQVLGESVLSQPGGAAVSSGVPPPVLPTLQTYVEGPGSSVPRFPSPPVDGTGIATGILESLRIPSEASRWGALNAMSRKQLVSSYFIQVRISHVSFSRVYCLLVISLLFLADV